MYVTTLQSTKLNVFCTNSFHGYLQSSSIDRDDFYNMSRQKKFVSDEVSSCTSTPKKDKVGGTYREWYAKIIYGKRDWQKENTLDEACDFNWADDSIIGFWIT